MNQFDVFGAVRIFVFEDGDIAANLLNIDRHDLAVDPVCAEEMLAPMQN